MFVRRSLRLKLATTFALAGMVLVLLLARAGVTVTLLEKHADFLRDFRGDTVHPSTMRLLDELGLRQGGLQGTASQGDESTQPAEQDDDWRAHQPEKGYSQLNQL